MDFLKVKKLLEIEQDKLLKEIVDKKSNQIIQIDDELGEDNIDNEIVEEGIGYKYIISDEKDARNVLEKIEETNEVPPHVISRINDLVESKTLDEKQSLVEVIQWLVNLPWNNSTEEEMDIVKVSKIINESHYGMEKVKNRFIEIFHAANLYKENNVKDVPPVICLVGSPGTGKTTLLQSFAKATNRKFKILTMSSIKDSIDLIGVSNVYQNSQPGLIIKTMQELGVNNPIILLDEVDKLSQIASANTRSGEMANIFLNMFDPAQSKYFYDSFLQIPYDLSNVTFICSANTTETIPEPLKNRMEIIYIDDYTTDEKLVILENNIIPKITKKSKDIGFEIDIDKSLFKTIVNYFSLDEGGVRQLSKGVKNLYEKTYYYLAKNKLNKIKIDKDLWCKLFGIDLMLNRNSKINSGFNLIKQRELKFGEIAVVVKENDNTTSIAILQGTISRLYKDQKFEMNTLIAKNLNPIIATIVNYLYWVDKELNISEEDLKDIGLPSFDLIRWQNTNENLSGGDWQLDLGAAICTVVISNLRRVAIPNDLSIIGRLTSRGDILPSNYIIDYLKYLISAGFKTIFVPEGNQETIKEFMTTINAKVKLIYVSNYSEIYKKIFNAKELS